MDVIAKAKPREFTVGNNKDITIKDCGNINLKADEQITFITDKNSEYDVCRKKWGFYATPSLNKRLAQHGFKSALIKNEFGCYYVMLVEYGFETDFANYLTDETQTFICWLNNSVDLDKITKQFNQNNTLRCICGSSDYVIAHEYKSKPAGETEFSFTKDNYHRRFYKCKACKHYFAEHNYKANDFYSGDYATATYGDKIKATFDKIISLPKDKSDNAARAAFVAKFLEPGSTLLDIGAGLSVFGYVMQNEYQIQCTALDPDKAQSTHAVNVGLKAIHADFLQDDLSIGKFDLISFNKVLEHVTNPIKMLSRAHNFLTKDGLVYVELPDIMAAGDQDGMLREEFFIEHFHVFSMQSISLLATRSGFVPQHIERIIEPSGKYTLRMIARSSG